MEDVTKFIPINGEGNTPNETNGGTGTTDNSTTNSTSDSSKFTAASTASSNLPAKKSFWTKLKGLLTYQINVELTPHQQKIEDEINEFLHQEITWQSFKNFLFKDITFGKKADKA